jgi:hypothetical protein
MKPTIVHRRRRNGLELIGAGTSIPQPKWQSEARAEVPDQVGEFTPSLPGRLREHRLARGGVAAVHVQHLSVMKEARSDSKNSAACATAKLHPSPPQAPTALLPSRAAASKSTPAAIFQIPDSSRSILGMLSSRPFNDFNREEIRAVMMGLVSRASS